MLTNLCQQENNELVNNFLNKSFFKAWKWDRNKPFPIEYGNMCKFELQVTAACNLKCKYCYYEKYSNISPLGDEGLYPSNISKPKDVLNNMDILFRWLEKNEMFPIFDIFSGELFATELGFKALEKTIDFYIRNKVTHRYISVPSNMSFIEDDNKVKRIEGLIKKCKDSNNKLFISASIDGLYCEKNRPFKSGGHKRDYDKLFAFCAKHEYLFHPMIYYDEIEHWKDNFLWFQQMVDKHKIPWSGVYLLEVRNDGWTVDSVKKANEFWEFVTIWTYNKVYPMFNDKYKTIKHILTNSLLNVFSIFSLIGRGMGCSIQSSVQLRLGDLTCNPCHRTSYSQFNTWKFEVEDNEITNIKALNQDLMIAVYTTAVTNFPYCQDCFIKHMCPGGCLGSQYESSGDLFTPIPSVCLLEHGKFYTILETMEKLDCIDSILKLVAPNIKSTILNYFKYVRRTK